MVPIEWPLGVLKSGKNFKTYKERKKNVDNKKQPHNSHS